MPLRGGLATKYTKNKGFACGKMCCHEMHESARKYKPRTCLPAVYYFTIPGTYLQFFLVYLMVFHSLMPSAFFHNCIAT